MAPAIPNALKAQLAPLKAALHGDGVPVLPFVGSGVSRGLLSWWELLDRLIGLAPEEQREDLRDALDDGEFLELADDLWAIEALRGPFKRFIRDEFDGKAAKTVRPTVFSAIAGLGPLQALTTNYDPWLLQAFSEAADRHLQPVLPDEPEEHALFGGTDPWVFHLHGAAARPRGCVLAWRHYQQLSHGSASWRDSLATLVRSRRLLFLGYSVSDPDVTAILEEFHVRSGGEAEQPHWWLGTPRRDKDGARNKAELRKLKRWERRLGVRPVDYGNHALLEPILRWLGQEAEPPTIDAPAPAAAPPADPSLAQRATLRATMNAVRNRIPALLQDLKHEGHDLSQLVVRRLAHHRGAAHADLTLKQILASGGRRWILEGAPGAGKSTLLRMHAGAEAEDDPPVVFLRISELLHQSLAEALAARCGAEVGAGLGHWHREKKLVVLLDGFDEVPAAAACQAIRRVEGELAGAPVRLLVAGRPTGFRHPEAVFPQTWARLELTPLSVARATELLEKQLGPQRRHAGAVLRRLRHLRQEEVWGNPLMLSLAARIGRLGGPAAVPTSRTALFEKAVRVLANSSHRVREGQLALAQTDAELDQRLDQLAYVALRLHEEPGEVLLESALRAGLAERGCTDAGAFLSTVGQVTALIERERDEDYREDHSVRFSHRTLREFLAGVALVRCLDDDDVVERVLAAALGDPGRWSQPLVHAVALLSGAAPRRFVRRSEAAAALVRRVVARQEARGDGSDKLSLAHLVLADAEDLDADVVLECLGLRPDRDQWEERAKVLERLPRLLGDAGPLLRCCAQVHRVLSAGGRRLHGADRFWLLHLVDGVAAEAEEPELRRQASMVHDRLFSDVPKEAEAEARAVLRRLAAHVAGRLGESVSEADPLRSLWREVSSGSFLMGSAPGSRDAYDDETPQHRVLVHYRFALMALPVPRGLYATLDPTVAGWVTDSEPMHSVSWWEAMSFARWLDRVLARAQWSVRLPTEVEWEYACRDDPWDASRLRDAGQHRTGEPQDVCIGGRDRESQINGRGLIDMLCNVEEWTLSPKTPDYRAIVKSSIDGVSHARPPADCADPSLERVLRGGGKDPFGPRRGRAAYRDWRAPSFVGTNQGFRVALVSRDSN